VDAGVAAAELGPTEVHAVVEGAGRVVVDRQPLLIGAVAAALVHGQHRVIPGEPAIGGAGDIDAGVAIAGRVVVAQIAGVGHAVVAEDVNRIALPDGVRTDNRRVLVEPGDAA